MGTFEKPLWQDNAGTGVPASYTANMDRQLVAAMFPYAGVIKPTDLVVTQRAAGADSSVDVSIGRCIIYQTGSTDRAYLCNMSGTFQNVPLPATPGSNSRYDMIYAVVQDSTISGSVDSFSLVAVSGTAAASPVEPAAPSGAGVHLLARVTRTAGTASVLNAAIQDRRIQLNPAPLKVSNGDNNVTPISATTISNGETVAGGTFVAPPSGRVEVSMNATWNMASGSAGNRLRLGPCIRRGATIGSGTVDFTPDSDPGTMVMSAISGTFAGGVSDIVTGLTPGTTYNATVVCWVDAGSSMNYFGRQISVVPLP